MAKKPQELSAEAKKEQVRAKARARKQRFDARMRNADAGEATERRHAVVIYLTDSAKNVLNQNRQRRRLLNLPSVLDSTLIEELLLGYSMKGESEFEVDLKSNDDVSRKGDVSKLLNANEKLRKAVQNYKLHLFAADGTIERLQQDIDTENEFRPLDWDEVERGLIAMHRFQLSVLGAHFTQQLLTRIRQTQGDQHALKVVDDEFTGYVSRLIDKLADHSLDDTALLSNSKTLR